MKTVVNERTIEFASPFIRDVAALIGQAVNIDSNQNKKIEITEWLSVGQTFVVTGLRHYSNLPDVLADLKDANSAERKDLIAVFTEGFDLPDDEAEALVEQTLAFVERTITDGIDLGKRWSELVQPAA